MGSPARTGFVLAGVLEQEVEGPLRGDVGSMVSPTGMLTRHARIAVTAMMRACNLVVALRLRAVSTCMRRWRLLEVIGINFLLCLSQYRERWENSNRQHES